MPNRQTIAGIAVLLLLCWGLMEFLSLALSAKADFEKDINKKVKFQKMAIHVSMDRQSKKRLCLRGLEYFSGNDAVYCYEYLVKTNMQNYKIHTQGMNAYAQVGEYDKAMELAKTYNPELVPEIQKLKEANK